MALVPIFSGRVSDDAVLVLFDTERTQRRTYLRTLVGQDVEVIVRKKRTQRSLDQNKYLHAVVFPLLADHCGYTLSEIKLVLMGECYGWHEVAGRELPIKPHTSEMTVDECTHFIEWVIPWALEKFDVHIPLPNEVAA